MRVALFILICGLLSGCGQVSRLWTNLTGELTQKCGPTGVLYVQSDSGLALLVDANNRPVPCEVK